jgi:hypothetical protein
MMAFGAAGDPIAEVPFWSGLAFILVGLVLLALGSRGVWLAAVAGGLMLGAGAAMVLGGLAMAPLGDATMLGSLVAGLALGIVAGWMGWRATR